MMSNIERILDRARWAPSGDNEQAWRVKILTGDSCEITTGYFLNSIFHLNRHSDHIALGCFLENIQLAAQDEGYNIILEQKTIVLGQAPIYLVTLEKLGQSVKNPIGAFIEQRSVNRFHYKLRNLTSDQKKCIEENLPKGFSILWFEKSRRLEFAKIVFKAANMRFLIPEMFDIHCKIIDWKNDQSPDKIPSKALGMPSIFLPVMKWMLGRWQRMELYNRFMCGHMMTSFKLDYIPCVFSSAGIAIIASKEPVTADDWVAAGRAIQRFWLTVTSLGLSHQPAFSPLLFSKYDLENKVFSAVPGIPEKNKSLKNSLSHLLGSDDVLKKTVWLGRVGYAYPKKARSVRVSIRS